MATKPGVPTVVAHADMKPCPRTVITVVPAADNKFLTIWRQEPQIGRVPVRGAYRVPVAGDLQVTDYEIGFGVEVIYSATAYDATGWIPSEPSQAPSVRMPYTGCPVVMDPVDPATAAVFGLKDWPERVHRREQTAVYPLTSDVATVLTGVRRKPESAMTVYTSTATQADALLELCRSPVILVRTDQRWRWRGGYFAPGEDVTETPHEPKDQLSFDLLWTVPLIPAGPPPPDLEVPVHTWDEVVTLYATWDAVVAAVPTWNQLVTNPKP